MLILNYIAYLSLVMAIQYTVQYFIFSFLLGSSGGVSGDVSSCDPMSSSLTPGMDSSELTGLFPSVPNSPVGLSPLSLAPQSVIGVGQPILNPGRLPLTGNQETLFLSHVFKGGQTRKHCFLAMFSKGGQTKKHCFLAMSTKDGQTRKQCFLAIPKVRPRIPSNFFPMWAN